MLQDELNRRQTRHRIWIGNAGKSGLTTRDYIVQLRHLLPQLERLDRVILLVGINDLALRLSQDEEYQADFLQQAGREKVLLQRSFQLLPIETEERLYPPERTAISALPGPGQGADGFPRPRQQDEAGSAYVTGASTWCEATRRREHLPDLASALGQTGATSVS